MHTGQPDTLPDGSTHPILPQQWVPAFRRAVIVLTIFHLIVFAIAIPLDYRNTLDDIAASDMRERLADIGMASGYFAGYLTGIAALSGILFTALGLLIMVRRPDAFMPLFVALVLVVEGTQISGIFYALDSLGVAGRWIADVSDAFSTVLLVTFFCIFPSGQFVPRWTRWFVLGMVVFALLGLVLQVRDPLTDYPLLTILFLLSGFGVMIYAQVHRYRRVRSPSQRQQVKWVVVGMIAALLCFTAAATGTAINPDRGPYAIMFWFTLANVGLVMIPASIAMAILRYHFLDIDRLINRTIVYGILVALLAVVYFASVFVLQWLLGSFAGSSNLAVALSTLVAVATFRPLRERVQRQVDRRFYRTRYDAAQILERFSHAVRDEVDLDRVQLVLAETIDTAIRPDRISLWLAEPGARNDLREEREHA